MKKLFMLFAYIIFGKLAFGQHARQILDYQYFRDEKTYYAFELFKNIENGMDEHLMLNFTSNSNYNKIEKVYVKAGNEEIRLKFKKREELVKSDNPEQKFYPILLNAKDFEDKNLPCSANIIFKLDNGLIYTLPFNTCAVMEFIAKN